MNSVNIIGNLTRDPEVKHTQGGMAIVELGIAWNGREKKGDEWVDKAHFFNVTCFGDRFEKVAQYLEKGKKVGISGRLEYQSWEDKDTGAKRNAVKIIANDITFASNAGDANGGPSRPADDEIPSSQFTPTGSASADDDDIPF